MFEIPNVRADTDAHVAHGGCMNTARLHWTHTPSIAFRHSPPGKDVVNQCLEFALNVDSGRKYPYHTGESNPRQCCAWFFDRRFP